MLCRYKGFPHRPGNLSSIRGVHLRVNRTESTKLSPNLHTKYQACTFIITGTKLKEFHFFLSVWKYLMLQIKEEHKGRVERRKEMHSDTTFSCYVRPMNIRIPLNISLWFANSLKILNSHRTSFP